MTLSYGPCGHPVSTLRRGEGCRICWLVDGNAPAVLETVQEMIARGNAVRHWRGREDEANDLGNSAADLTCLVLNTSTNEERAATESRSRQHGEVDYNRRGSR